MDNTRSNELRHLRVETQRDVCRLWQLLMRPLGFSHGSLWVVCIAPDGRPVPGIAEISDADEVPSQVQVDNLYATFSRAFADAGDGSRLAFLISRPGVAPVGRHDARFGRALVDGARRNGVRIEMVHLATDTAIVPLTPDDLVAAAPRRH